jgi:hydrogenase/urease accessory protein HupE
MSRALACVALLIASTLFPDTPAYPHDSQPIYVELVQTSQRDYLLQWKVPYFLPSSDVPTVSISSSACAARGVSTEFRASDGLIRRADYDCVGDLAGGTVTINYPHATPSIASVISYSTLGGERRIGILGPDASDWAIPPAETRSSVGFQYLTLGIRHIWSGADHMLFLACLFWIAGTFRRVLATITGFTVAHSVTLVCSALSVIEPPVPFVEATIALSIVCLATEIVRGRGTSVVWRYPLSVSSCFGLLHGFGFAAALHEIGLPQKELVTALLCFNVGVEIGQVVFASTAMALIALVRRTYSQRQLVAAVLPRVAAYSIGTLATFWTIERVAAF